jgi:hypothetical protein
MIRAAMAAIFTPGLKVTERTVVVKDRRLPLEGEVLVKVGDRVSARDVVARTQLPGKVYPVNVANVLGVDPGRLGESMRKKVGDPVTEGEIIARTDGFFGMFGSEAKAIVSGTIESISIVTGQVIIQASPIPVEIDAYIDGRVVEVHPREGCSVQATATLVQGIFGLGGELQAPLVMAATDPTQVLDGSSFTEAMRGQIVVGGSYIDLGGLERAKALGVAGVVTGGFDYDEIKELLGYEVGVAITGGEELGFTLVVTEGFGRIDMAPKTFALLKKSAGRQASINGATQIRAGVIRPEIVVTLGDDGPVEKWIAPEPKGLEIGDPVRGIRSPYFGRLGKVVALPVELVTLATESPARVMDVEFADGTRARLPRANVEVIER